VRAAPSAIPASVRRFNARARARRIRSARPWLIAAAATALAGILAWVILGTSVLGVARISVRGAGFVGADAVRAAAGVPIGTPMATVDTKAVAARVETILGVAHADVARNWPSTLTITVRLRQAVAVVPVASGYVLLDPSGVAFRPVTDRPPDLALLILATPGPADPSTTGALSVLASLPDRLRGQLVRLSAETPARIQLMLKGGREIIWGDATDNETKARVAMSLLGRPSTVIDVSAPNVVTVN
jgi:cell division protein FtsQ